MQQAESGVMTSNFAEEVDLRGGNTALVTMNYMPPSNLYVMELFRHPLMRGAQQTAPCEKQSHGGATQSTTKVID